MSTRSMKLAAMFLAALLPAVAAAAFFDSSSAGRAIADADRAFCKATRARGLDGWVEFFSDDAVLGQFDPPAKGKDGIRKAYAGLFARRDLDFQWAPETSASLPQGSLGYSVGHYRMRFTDDKGAAQDRTGNYLTVWQKQKDGNWRVIADFGSPDQPAQ